MSCSQRSLVVYKTLLRSLLHDAQRTLATPWISMFVCPVSVSAMLVSLTAILQVYLHCYALDGITYHLFDPLGTHSLRNADDLAKMKQIAYQDNLVGLYAPTPRARLLTRPQSPTKNTTSPTCSLPRSCRSSPSTSGAFPARAASPRK